MKKSENNNSSRFDEADEQIRYKILEDNKVSLDDKVACLLSMQPDITMSKDELRAMLADKESSKDFLDFLKGMRDVHEDFEHLMNSFRIRLNDFQTMHPQQLTCMGLFHIEGNPYAQEPGMGGVSHCLTNILSTANDTQSEKEKAHIIEILFNNSKMCRAFCDIIVGAYLCIKKAGLDKDSSYLPSPEEIAKNNCKPKTKKKK